MLKDVTATALEIANDYAVLSEVVAVTLGGSHASALADSGSDIDLYVYTTDDVPVASRMALAARRGRNVEVNNQFWEPGDEWDEMDSGLHIEL